jgi:signal transduction histidine kinase
MNESDSPSVEDNSKKDDWWKSLPPKNVLAIFLNELRTPLIVIKGYTTILSDDSNDKLHPEALGAISMNIERIEKMMDDTLDYIRELNIRDQNS